MISRREALRRLGVATTSALFRSDVAAHESIFRFADQPVDLIVSTLSPETIRIRLVARGTNASINPDGALVGFAEHPGRHVRAAGRFAAGALSVDVKANPLSVAISSRERRVQVIEFQDPPGRIHFLTDDVPVLGLGEGGPQFDRRGARDTMRSGQGGYQLRTHGGRVPVQWLIGTGGWGLYIHHPLGEFDLTGSGRGVFTSPDPLPVDLFLVVSRDPAVILRGYSRITGLPAMPPLWTFGYQQSHRTLAGPADVISVARTSAREEAPVRHADLSRH